VSDSSGSLRDRLVRSIRFVGGHAEVWRVFEDADLFRDAVLAMAAPWRLLEPTKVAGVEARGFILGSAVAMELGTGFVAIRKSDGRFAGVKAEATTDPDYQGLTHRLRVRRDSLLPGDRVLLVDDWVEVGAQAIGAMRLIDSCGATFLGLSVIVNQALPEVVERFARLEALVEADELAADERP
jgi:adenine phosphoribosyltransferase